MTNPTLFTSRYAYKDLVAFDGLKVQISNGGPKWQVPYPLFVVKLLAPPYWIAWDSLFKDRYLAYLEEVGFDKIRDVLSKISELNGNQSLVLLCHENVMKGKDCHRRHFAEWWEGKTGEKVEEVEKLIYDQLPPEVAENKPPETPKASNIQMKLF